MIKPILLLSLWQTVFLGPPVYMNSFYQKNRNKKIKIDVPEQFSKKQTPDFYRWTLDN